MKEILTAPPPAKRNGFPLPSGTGFKDFVVKHHESLVILSVGLSLLLNFAVGTARYRMVLVLAGYFILRALLVNIEKEYSILKFLLCPLLMLSLYLDVTHGQINAIYTRMNVVISFLALVISERLVKRSVWYALGRISANELFVVCPGCRYENNEMVNECPQCAYRLGAPIERSINAGSNEADPAVSGEIQNYKAMGLYRQPSKNLLGILGLHQDETILMNMSTLPMLDFYMDGMKRPVFTIVLTIERIICVDHMFFSKGWKIRETIRYNDILHLSASRDRARVGEKLLLSIATASHCYEIAFSYFLPDSDQIQIQKIRTIIDCICKRNELVNVTFDMPSRAE